MRFHAAALIILSILTGTAHADSLQDKFTLTGNGINLSFVLAASPTPEFSDPDLGFAVSGLALDANGVAYISNPALFYVDAVGGGFALLDDADLVLNFAFGGAQLFTGGTAEPTFLQGNYSLTGLFCPGEDPDNPSSTCKQDPYNLTIAADAAITPEPNTFLLLFTGTAALGVVARERYFAR